MFPLMKDSLDPLEANLKILNIYVFIYTHIYMCIYTCIYVYVLYMYFFINLTYIYIYIYLFIYNVPPGAGCIRGVRRRHAVPDEGHARPH